MAHYTIFELERIEKVLEAKLYAAKEAYNKRLDLLHRTFKEKVSFDPNNVISDEVKEAWATYQVNDMDLQLLLSEVDLFERGINALYSYWNSAVEIFIDTMREKTEERMVEG